MTIYLADDDEDDRIFFRDAFSDIPSDSEISEFTNGVALLKALHDASELPDVIFLDLNMPLMDGFECLADIRDIKKFSKIPVIIYSTSFHKKEVERLQEMGATKYLKKPSSFNQLKTLLNKSLQDVKALQSSKKDTSEQSFLVE
ncbi:response regulator [Costertonia aggregata]|uniref:Response regulator n=1 Tax=Costertonia aggregata TaxID=343403 RepID=A0A7H9AT30_9FLAO|nr:response regulator [Costertonia aggregata]QLG46567.1 response regulator [Costertonia aggregata]